MTRARKSQEVPDGSLSTHNGFSLISNEKLLEIYATMLKCRMLEERIHELSKPNKGGKSSPASVHVAAVAGAVIDLLPGDTLAPSHGAWTPCFAKGLKLSAIVATASGRTDVVRPAYASRSVVPPAQVAVKQIERAVEAAAGHKANRNKNVVTLFSSDTTAPASELQNAIKFAGKKKLPILFVLELRPGSDDLIALARECDVPAVAVEDDDAVAIYRVSTEALAHARRGNGPTLIACGPWPFGETGATRRRSAKHPISKMEAYLAAKGLFSRKFKTNVIAEFSRELEAAIKAVR